MSYAQNISSNNMEYPFLNLKITSLKFASEKCYWLLENFSIIPHGRAEVLPAPKNSRQNIQINSDFLPYVSFCVLSNRLHQLSALQLQCSSIHGHHVNDITALVTLGSSLGNLKHLQYLLLHELLILVFLYHFCTEIAFTGHF